MKLEASDLLACYGYVLCKRCGLELDDLTTEIEPISPDTSHASTPQIHAPFDKRTYLQHVELALLGCRRDDAHVLDHVARGQPDRAGADLTG
ncbi:hypothetical protein EWM64_g4615 [Hericium alpestre]|uniref:Uncharacterized protein n=1 Tax=Hericium alpestre TaxID=135208 RepID=A0A4Y9ZWY9_9AGAM|nr:hypothetical protein EWM64_g4615 [Hericium alpestre]